MNTTFLIKKISLAAILAIGLSACSVGIRPIENNALLTQS